jgi:hypothetical protein
MSAMKPAMNALSVSVFVCTSLFSKFASMALATAAAWFEFATRMLNVPAPA